MSACLLGARVRYDGADRALGHPALERWRQDGRIVTICPEISAGFCVPRLPAEIAGGASGAHVLAGLARVIDSAGTDVTAGFIDGAQAALKVALANACRFALLIDGSPSCGSGFVYDGSFRGIRHEGSGVTAALLRQHGIAVFSPARIDDLDAALQ